MRPSLGFVCRLCWTGFLGLLIKCMLRLPILGYGQGLCAVPLIMAGWYLPVSRYYCQLAACRYRSCVAYCERRVHSGSSDIPDGECGVMRI